MGSNRSAGGPALPPRVQRRQLAIAEEQQARFWPSGPQPLQDRELQRVLGGITGDPVGVSAATSVESPRLGPASRGWFPNPSGLAGIILNFSERKRCHAHRHREGDGDQHRDNIARGRVELDESLVPGLAAILCL